MFTSERGEAASSLRRVTNLSHESYDPRKLMLTAHVEDVRSWKNQSWEFASLDEREVVDAHGALDPNRR